MLSNPRSVLFIIGNDSARLNGRFQRMAEPPNIGRKPYRNPASLSPPVQSFAQPIALLLERIEHPIKGC